MNAIDFTTWALDVAFKHAPARNSYMFNGTLFIEECSAKEAVQIQNEAEALGVGMIVTPSHGEYAFDFV